MVAKPYIMASLTTVFIGVLFCPCDPFCWKPLEEVVLTAVVTMDSHFFMPKSFSRFLATTVVNLN